MTSMEELIQNFMIVTEGPQIPPGEVYFEAEIDDVTFTRRYAIAGDLAARPLPLRFPVRQEAPPRSSVRGPSC